ncbi:MAG: hypothetical protein Q7T03_04185 [Deltaproteobacteria bacterium]|nr:hypothetical protein [Deltaproteobacteria bacterium]
MNERLVLAEALLDLLPAEKILAISREPATERMQKLLVRNAVYLEKLGVLGFLTDQIEKWEPLDLFNRIHSPLEFLLERLQEKPLLPERDLLYFEEHVRRLCAPHLKVPFSLYSAAALERERNDILMEDKPGYRLEKEGPAFDRLSNLVAGAGKRIREMEPLLAEETFFFIRTLVVDFSLEGVLLYSSLPWQPGTVEIAPRLIAKREGHTRFSDALLELLTAAQLVHESRHQKHYYLFRCEDTEPVSIGQFGFVKPEFTGIPLNVTWSALPTTKPFHKFFTLAISIGWELRFLEASRGRGGLTDEEDRVVESLIRRKRKYLLPLLVQGELFRDLFTPEGEHLLEKLFVWSGYH